jgi:hypothetical protein
MHYGAGRMSDENLKQIQSRDHPHYGESGWLVPDTLQPATGQFYFKLSNCQHDTAGCYVLEADLVEPSAVIETEKEPTQPTKFDPLKYTDATRDRLIEAFENLYNVSEACQHAGISRDTYYEWLKQIDGFEAMMEEAKQTPLKSAKMLLRTAIVSGDTSTAKWLLERKDPEFKPKAEVDNNHQLKETREKLGNVLDERTTDDFGEQPAATPGETSGAEVPQNPTDIS